MKGHVQKWGIMTQNQSPIPMWGLCGIQMCNQTLANILQTFYNMNVFVDKNCSYDQIKQQRPAIIISTVDVSDIQRFN